jgi:hypothetical protein
VHDQPATPPPLEQGGGLSERAALRHTCPSPLVVADRALFWCGAAVSGAADLEYQNVAWRQVEQIQGEQHRLAEATSGRPATAPVALVRP